MIQLILIIFSTFFIWLISFKKEKTLNDINNTIIHMWLIIMNAIIYILTK